MPALQRKLINLDIARVDAEEVHQATEFQAAIPAGVAGHYGALRSRIKPLASHMVIVGSATTVEIRPGGNLVTCATMIVAKPGDMLVIDGKGSLPCVLLGEIMTTQTQASGIIGVITNNAVYNAETLSSQHLPVFAVGLDLCGSTKFIPGRINHAISIGGAVTQAGDLVVGDIDGMVVVPRDKVCTIIELAKGRLAVEPKRLVVTRGSDLRPRWLENALRQAGILSEGETLP